MLDRAARQSRLVSGSVATPEHEEKIIGKRVLPGTGGAGDTKRRGSRGMKTTVTDWLASPELKSAEAVNHNVIPTHAAVTARASMWLLRALGSLAAATPVMSPPIWCV